MIISDRSFALLILAESWRSAFRSLRCPTCRPWRTKRYHSSRKNSRYMNVFWLQTQCIYHYILNILYYHYHLMRIRSEQKYITQVSSLAFNTRSNHDPVTQVTPILRTNSGEHGRVDTRTLTEMRHEAGREVFQKYMKRLDPDLNPDAFKPTARCYACATGNRSQDHLSQCIHVVWSYDVGPSISIQT